MAAPNYCMVWNVVYQDRETLQALQTIEMNFLWVQRYLLLGRVYNSDAGAALNIKEVTTAY